MVLADEMIASLKATPEFYEAFQQVKLDSFDNREYGGEHVVVIVAKGEHADRLARAYNEASNSQARPE